MAPTTAVQIRLLTPSQIEFRWASDIGGNSLPYPEELEYLGFVRAAQHPVYPSSWLMKRDG